MPNKNDKRANCIFKEVLSNRYDLLDLFHKSFFTQFQIIDPSN